MYGPEKKLHREAYLEITLHAGNNDCQSYKFTARKLRTKAATDQKVTLYLFEGKAGKNATVP